MASKKKAPPKGDTVKKAPPLRLEWIDPATLAENPQNWRRHPENQLAALKDVVAEVGWAGALLYNERTKRLIDGHGRKKIAKPGEPVPVLIGNWTEATERKILATLDPLAAMAQADNDALRSLIAGVETDSDAIKAMLAGLAGAPGAGDDGALVDPEVPEPGPKPTTKRGDLWLLGPHRLLCGDSTKAEDVAKLMNGKQAALVVTDPPYGVSYVGKTADALQISNDGRRDDGLVAMLEPAFKQIVKHTRPTAAIYIWHASSTRRDFEWAMDAAGLVEKQYLTWVKQQFVLGHSDYHYQTEPCFYACHRGQKPAFYGDRAQASTWRVAAHTTDGERIVSLAGGIRLSDGRTAEIFISTKAPKGKKIPLLRLKEDESIHLADQADGTDAWEVDRPSRSEDHPTTKPAELAAISIRNSSLPGEIVLDLFGGAGFACLAAEQLGRIAHTMELDPRYCDAIVARWEKITGKKAERQ